MSLTTLQQNKLDKIKKLLDSGNVGIITYLMSLEDRLEEEIPQMKNIVERMKGDDGEDYILTDSDKKEIASQCYDMMDNEAIAQKVLSLIDIPLEDIALKASKLIDVPKAEKVDYKKIKKEVLAEIVIPEPKDGKDADEEIIMQEVVSTMEKNLPQFGEAFRDGLELLQGDNRLSLTAIKGIEDYKEISKLARDGQFLNRGGNGKGLLSQQNDVNIINPTNAQVLKYNSTSGKWENGTGGGTSGVSSVVSGINISVDATDPANPIINSLSDRYKTTSTTSQAIVPTGTLTFTVDSNLAYTSQQDVIIVYDSNNHMHGQVSSYSGTTLIVDITHKTGSGTYTSWTINLDGITAGDIGWTKSGTNVILSTTTDKVGIGTTPGTNDGKLRLGGNISSAGRTTLGAYFTMDNLSIATDTTSTGTVAIAAGMSLFGTTFATSNTTTYTNAATLYLASAPTASTNVTITAPWSLYISTGNARFGGGVQLASWLQFGTTNQIIYDSNANEYLKFSTTASAVNELTIANAATGNSPTISATGGDTNISIALTPKGTGGVGIGTTNPSAKLEISGSSIAGDFMVTNSSSASSISVASLLAASAPGDTYFSIGRALSAANSALIGHSTVGGGNYAFMTTYGRPAADFAVASTGNVGMGTSTPAEKLDVYGNIKIGPSTRSTMISGALPNFGGSYTGFGITGSAGTNLEVSINGVVGFFGVEAFFAMGDRINGGGYGVSNSGGFYKNSGIWHFWNNPLSQNTMSVADNGDVAIGVSAYGTYTSTSSTSTIPAGFYVNKPLSIFNGVIRLKGYTVATLPAGTIGDTCYVTDALAPTFLAVLVGGGAIVTTAFYNGTNWIAQ